MFTNAGLQRIRRVALRHQVASMIRMAILEGRLKPGQKLVERVLADAMEVSQSAVREALPELEHEGLLIRKPNSGTFVTELSRSKLSEMIEARLLLEPRAMALAARNMTTERERELQALANTYNECISAADAYRTAQTDLAFHRRVWEISGNETLVKLLGQVCIPAFAFVMIRLSASRAELAERADVHQTIVDHLASGDMELAAGAAREHIVNAWGSYIEKG